MSDYELSLPVSFGGSDFEFPMRIVPQGYTYRFAVLVEGTEVVYERDDAGELRALIAPQDGEGAAMLPAHGLLQAIAEVLEGLTRT